MQRRGCNETSLVHPNGTSRRGTDGPCRCTRRWSWRVTSRETLPDVSRLAVTSNARHGYHS